MKPKWAYLRWATLLVFLTAFSWLNKDHWDESKTQIVFAAIACFGGAEVAIRKAGKSDG